MRNDKNLLRDRAIAVLVADGFEWIELSVPRKALERAGAKVEIISLREGKVRGMNLTEPTKKTRVDQVLDAADPEAYDGLFLPGGFISPDFLRQSRRARAFVRAFEEANKPIATICHGPWTLVSADLVAGRKLAAWPGLRDDIVHAGGIWRDEPVVKDGNWVSSRSPLDLPEFVPAMCELYARGETGVRANQGEMTSSPQPDDPPMAAVKGARLMPAPFMGMLTAAALGVAVGVAIKARGE